MNSKIYRQADSRWGSLPYPTKAYTFAKNGCGCCAVTHCAIEIEKYKKYTPADVRKFMVQYATMGNGTLWSGITEGLKHYGYTNIKRPATMKEAWVELNKGNRIGVILFKKGTKGGVTWTTGGHYVAFLNYKVENGKHYFYTKDSGGRKNDGWHCYETTMMGLIPQIWITKRLTEKKVEPKKPVTVKKPTGKYSGTIPTPTLKIGSEGAKVKNLQKFLNWYGGFKLVVDGIFGEKTDSALKIFQNTEGITNGVYGEKSYTKAKAYAKPKQPKAKPIIDVSSWQGDVDWAKVAKEVDGVIIRASFTNQKSFILSDDSKFASYIKGARDQKLPIGAYHYSQAISVAEAKREAEHLCNKLNAYKKSITLPVVCDWEFGGRLNASKAKSLGKAKCTAIVEAFCEEVKAKGYTPMVYANTSTFNGYLNYKTLKSKYLIWLAQYASKAELDYNYWQYSSSGKIKGISGNVDVSKKK